MKSIMIFAAVGVLLGTAQPVPVRAQARPDPDAEAYQQLVAQALKPYRGCINSTAERLAEGTESASDVATAVVALCSTELTQADLEMQEIRRAGSASEFVNLLIENSWPRAVRQLPETSRQIAVTVVVTKRASKGKPAQPNNSSKPTPLRGAA